MKDLVSFLIFKRFTDSTNSMVWYEKDNFDQCARRSRARVTPSRFWSRPAPASDIGKSLQTTRCATRSATSPGTASAEADALSGRTRLGSRTLRCLLCEQGFEVAALSAIRRCHCDLAAVRARKVERRDSADDKRCRLLRWESLGRLTTCCLAGNFVCVDARKR